MPAAFHGLALRATSLHAFGVMVSAVVAGSLFSMLFVTSFMYASNAFAVLAVVDFVPNVFVKLASTSGTGSVVCVLPVFCTSIDLGLRSNLLLCCCLSIFSFCFLALWLAAFSCSVRFDMYAFRHLSVTCDLTFRFLAMLPRREAAFFVSFCPFALASRMP